MKSSQKTSMKKWMGLVLAGGLLTSGLAQAEFDRGSMLANTCVGCHGIDGISSGPAIPSIAGMSEYYFIETMKEYRDDVRPSTIMGRLARGYSDQDIKDMAKYFSNLEYVQVQQPHDPQMAQVGKRLHSSFCDRCHDAGGTIADDDAGFLSGQMRPYLQYALEDYMQGNRNFVESRMERELNSLINRHGEEGIQQLLEYYASGQE